MTRNDIIAAIQAEAASQGVPPSLALSVVTTESRLDPNAIGAAGEIGLFQLEPDTAASLGVDPTDVMQNIQGGVHYLAQLLAQFGGDVSLAVAAYNAGPGRVSTALATRGSNWQSAIPASTRSYIARVLGGSYIASPAAGELAAAGGMPLPVTAAPSLPLPLLALAAGILILAVAA